MGESREILAQAPVVPVLTIENPLHAVPLARALVEGGLPVLEVTLRTEAGLAAITAIAREVPGAIVGAGTVRGAEDYAAACAAGSRFIVSPGLTDTLLNAASSHAVPLIPGVATVSEMMHALDHGIDCLKFFPAEASGGAATLKAFYGPFPDVSFCPTGGVGLHNIADYLAVPSVITVGGTWLTPTSLLQAEDWEAIAGLAREAATTVSRLRGEQ